MKRGSAIGMTLCIAISGAAGSAVGAFVLPWCPPFVMLSALVQASIDDDRWMRSLDATLSLLWEAAVVGAGVGALLAWLRLRGVVPRGCKLRPGTRSAQDRTAWESSTGSSGRAHIATTTRSRATAPTSSITWSAGAWPASR